MDEKALLPKVYDAAQTLVEELAHCLEAAAGDRETRSRAREALNAWEDIARVYHGYQRRVGKASTRAWTRRSRREREGTPLVERIAKDHGDRVAARGGELHSRTL